MPDPTARTSVADEPQMPSRLKVAVEIPVLWTVQAAPLKCRRTPPPPAYTSVGDEPHTATRIWFTGLVWAVQVEPSKNQIAPLAPTAKTWLASKAQTPLRSKVPWVVVVVVEPS